MSVLFSSCIVSFQLHFPHRSILVCDWLRGSGACGWCSVCHENMFLLPKCWIFRINWSSFTLVLFSNVVVVINVYRFVLTRTGYCFWSVFVLFSFMESLSPGNRSWSCSVESSLTRTSSMLFDLLTHQHPGTDSVPLPVFTFTSSSSASYLSRPFLSSFISWASEPLEDVCSLIGLSVH